MTASPSVLVGIATYNEAQNLPSLVARLHDLLPAADVLVVDDNSPDGTGRWCTDFSATHPWFQVIQREGKLGLGTALAVLMERSLEREADLLVTLDADWSHPPDSVPDLIEATEYADVAIGSRYCLGGSVYDWPWPRRVISRLMNWLSRMILRLPVSDSSSNFRVYRSTALAARPWQNVRSTGYAFIEEILFSLRKSGARFAEIPIDFTNRKTGDSKVSWREAWGAVQMLSRMLLARFR